ncbi:hypothetical protein [Streptomyces sp. 7N604]|uniref:hypothetical protein n=1 Tax=Streptomyces sp. 7N604 TaxID=3457415 RepID=UPI003FD543BA
MSESESDQVTAKDHRWGIWVTAGAAVLAALITGILGLLGSDDSGGETANTTAETTPPPSPSRSAASSSSSASSTPTPLPEPEPVTATGLNLPNDYYFSLTDDPIRPREGLNGDFSYSNGTHVNSDSNDGAGKLVLLDPGQEGSLKVCRSDTRYTENIDVPRLSKGAQICVIKAGHVGLVTVRAMPDDQAPSQYFTLDVKIWRNAVPSDPEN